MFVVLYRWRIKPDLESQFAESWSEISAYYRAHFGSLGSRLHRGSDGLFYSYAQWKSAEQREDSFASEVSAVSEAGRRASEAIEESFPEIILEIVSDYIIPPEKK